MRIFSLKRFMAIGTCLLAVSLHQAAFAAPPADSPKIGDRMADGTVLAGISPETGNPMYTTPADAPGVYNATSYTVQACTNNTDDHGHHDWRVPTQNELNVLFENNSVIGGFNTSGSLSAGWYRSSTPSNNDTTWGQRFSDGRQREYYKGLGSSLRCVR